MWELLQYKGAFDRLALELDAKSRATLDSKMTMLRENGPGWRSNAIEKLGEGVYEMRSGRSRLYFAVLSGTRIVVLDAHIKKSKKEQSKIIQRAIELLRDLKSMEVIGDVSGIN